MGENSGANQESATLAGALAVGVEEFLEFAQQKKSFSEAAASVLRRLSGDR